MSQHEEYTMPPGLRVSGGVGGTGKLVPALIDPTTPPSIGDTLVWNGTLWVPSGGGSVPNLAAVLTEGNDTGGVEIVHTPAANTNANVNRIATGTGNGSAAANATATATGDGSAEANHTATSGAVGDAAANASATTSGPGTASATTRAEATADGDADASVSALAVDGEAKANREAYSAAYRAEANTTVTADADRARANTAVSGGGSGDAELHLSAMVAGTGMASADLRVFKNDSDTTGVGMRVEATGAGGYKMGFGQVAGTPIAIPQVPASPSVQDVVNALTALGLITQAA